MWLGRIFLSEWEQGWCGNHVGMRSRFQPPSCDFWVLINNILLLVDFFPLPFFLSNVPLCCWAEGQRKLLLYGQPFGDMSRAKVVVFWLAWRWWPIGLLWVRWTEVALEEPWLEAGSQLAFSLPQVLTPALNPWSWSSMWWCLTMKNRRTLRSAYRLERLWM